MSKLRIHYIQHVPFEGLGYIENWINNNNYSLSHTKIFEEIIFPNPKDIDWLIIMGGPMNINDEDEYSWLVEEKKFIKSMVDANKVVIGICLGAQLIAHVLDAEVYPNKKKEIGWFPVKLTSEAVNNNLFESFPEVFSVLHWHGDTFDLPNKAIHLLETDACKNQAFLYNEKVLGLQFHLEATPASLKDMIDNCENELVIGEFIQTEEEMVANRSLCNNTNQYLDTLLNKLA